MEKSALPTSMHEEDPAPPYSEPSNQTLNTSSTYSKSNVPTTKLPLQTHLSQSRSARIQSIIGTYIEPLLLTQGDAGILKTTFLLVPSNVRSLQHPNDSDSECDSDSSDIIEGTGTGHNNCGRTNQDEIVGFPANEYVKLVRLHGADHSNQFWRQPVVLSELESSLKARLANSGHVIYQPQKPAAEEVEPPPQSPKQPKQSFWRKKSKASAKDLAEVGDEDVTRNLKLGWRAEGDDGSKAVDPGETRVSVGLKEVCLRTVSPMGLYETKTGQAVAVGVEVGA